jgi:hypothetical protein
MCRPERFAVWICIHTYIHTCIHTYIYSYITYICADPRDLQFEYAYIHTHTHIHTYIHTYIHTHIHSYITYICAGPRDLPLEFGDLKRMLLDLEASIPDSVCTWMRMHVCMRAYTHTHIFIHTHAHTHTHTHKPPYQARYVRVLVSYAANASFNTHTYTIWMLS